LAARMHRPVALVEVLRAERADVPLWTDQLPAARADPLQPCAAGRAEDEVVLDAFLASRTHHTLLGLAEEALFPQLTLVRLAQGLLWPDDEIQEETEDVEDDHHETREVREDLVLGPMLRVAHGPEDHREVEREHVKPRETDRELDERVVDERGPQTGQ